MLYDEGINYICQKYGNSEECVVSIAEGMTCNWTDSDGTTYTGTHIGTPDIVWAIIQGLVTSITMTNPSRPIINNPKAALTAANKRIEPVGSDADELVNHIEGTEDQWCYEPSQQYTLTVTISPVGTGLVSLYPPGGIYDENEIVTLTATAGTGYRFDHWSGAISGSTNPKTITMNGNKSVTAHFILLGGCTSPSGGEGDTVCFGQDMYVCQSGSWTLLQDNHPDCAGCDCNQESQELCEQQIDGEGEHCCFWYQRYIWEPAKCHDKPQNWLNDYLPFIVAGGGTLVLLLAIASSRKKKGYYPPPPGA